MAAEGEQPNPSGGENPVLNQLLKVFGLDLDDDDSEEEQEEEEEAEKQQRKEASDSDEDDMDVPDIQEWGEYDEEKELKDFSKETNIRRFSRVLDSRGVRTRQEMEDRDYEFYEDLFDFPADPEKWTEEDIEEYWVEAPQDMTKPGWDPVWADEDDWEVVLQELQAGRDPRIAPFYIPYHNYYPVIPDNHFDISTPKAVVEELDRIEEFLKWCSYTFQDGTSYEGTVWDDLAHGKGVYVSDQGLVRYEGEWFRNAMEGHGVVEVDIPEIQPRPGSKLEAKMRAEGKIIKADYMSPKDRKWLEMDIEDSIFLSSGRAEIPFYENDEWAQIFGEKPEKGRYKYAGQWKHGRMHGCGVYEVNERVIYGRFYFGEHLDGSTDCDADVSALHAGIAEVAAAKARMFVNKPDGMVREHRGPFCDPQHPYFYEEDDAWMAPGFINQFYDVPDYWKTYVQDVDQEREMWLNSFYKAPLRIPMPAELEYWWENDESPEFILINKEPEPDPEDPSKLIYTEDPLILHTRTGRLINYVDDDKYGIRLFWQPPLEKGEEIDPEKVEFLPLGFDEYYGRAKPVEKKENSLMRLMTSIENAVKPMLERVEKWTEEKKKASEINRKLIEHELELIEAEICLEEELEELDMALRKKQEEEEKAAAQVKMDLSATEGPNEVGTEEGEEEGEGEEAPSSFGTVAGRDVDQKAPADVKKRNQPKRSPFSSLSLSFGSSSVAFAVPQKLHESFLSWKRGRQPVTAEVFPDLGSEESFHFRDARVSSISYHRSLGPQTRLKVAQQEWRRSTKSNNSRSRLNGLAQILLSPRGSRRSKTCHSEDVMWNETWRRSMLDFGNYPLNIMSLHVA